MQSDIIQRKVLTVRIPVSWHNHLDSDFNINEEWLGKVSEIVNYALSQDMYVILNIHHDCEKSSGFTSPDYDPEWAAGNKDCYIYPDNEHLESSIKYVTKIWEQLGEEFKDCDNHLVFETMNEPRQVGNIHEWWYADDECCHEALECITQINQAAVDAIRKTGGNNSNRYIMVPATSAKAEAAMQSKYFKMPEDSAKDRLILSVHAYEPFDFSMNKTITAKYDVIMIKLSGTVQAAVYILNILLIRRKTENSYIKNTNSTREIPR